MPGLTPRERLTQKRSSVKTRTKLLLLIVFVALFYAGLVLKTGDLGVKKISKNEISEFIGDVPGSAEVSLAITMREGNPEHEADHFIGPFRGLTGVRKVIVLPTESRMKVVFDPSVISEAEIRGRLN
jgi:hypothetical protein